MPVVIQFDQDEEHERAIDVLTEAEETYHGVAPATILVSNAALCALQAHGVRFQVLSETAKEQPHAPGT
jgi:hypothetical protein